MRSNGLTLTQYRKKFEVFCEEFVPEDYGYTEEDFENGEIDLRELFIYANYGNSTTAQYLRDEL